MSRSDAAFAAHRPRHRAKEAFIGTQAPAKPDWLKVRLPGGPVAARVAAVLKDRRLHTVCEEARCPNRGECWGCGTATFMVLGDTCTRSCRFCAVRSGHPGGAIDSAEPAHLAEAVEALQLSYVVLTMVTRDDLADGGADHLALCVERILARSPSTRIETLSSDFLGRDASLARLASCGAAVLAHNVETVESLTPSVRDPRASYARSLAVLARLKALSNGRLTKSGFSLGLGETDADVRKTLRDLRDAGVDILTIGQYLRPSARHAPVIEYVAPSRFDAYRAMALSMGFRGVAAGPLVRSSYRAGEFFRQARGPSPSPDGGGGMHGAG